MGLTTQPIRPMFKLEANDRDITSSILDRFISLRLTDETGNTSDMLEITLADHDPSMPIKIPPTGAELKLSLGYDSNVRYMGMFVVDEIDISGWPQEMTIRARAAPYEQSKGGKSNLQTQKVRTWKAGTTIGAIVKKIAKEHGMQGLVAKSLASIQIPHIDQPDESDINFLLRLAKKYDAVVKPMAGKLIMAKRGEFKSVSGQDLPSATIDAKDCSRWRLVESRRESAGKIVAYWHAVKQSKRHEVSVGSGEPVRRLKQYFPTQAQAVAAATAELSRRKRAMKTFSIALTGRNDLAAESKIILTGFREGIPTEWVATRVEHDLGSSGYVCIVEMEQPNSGESYDVEDVAS